MRPITFERRQTIPKSAVAICSEIADLSRWSEFNGYAILPGIESAEYEHRTDEVVGSRIRVRNRDGSTHAEEICEWNPGERIVMKLHSFTPPLNRLATHFIEEWRFEATGNATLVTRKFQIFPIYPMARPLLWLISLFFRRAITLHLARMAAQEPGQSKRLE